MKWLRSSYDAAGDTVVTDYGVYRRQDEYLRLADPEGHWISGTVAADSRMDGWDYVASIPARRDSVYQTVVSTLCDSTAEGGICWAAFLVSAMTSDPGIFFDSQPDSGYSVDNLAPGVPDGLHFESPLLLAWQESDAEDFCYFTVYGSHIDQLDETAVLITHTTGTSVQISEHTHWYYHVTATDFAGNEGDEATTRDPAQVSPAVDPPGTFDLYQNQPNPGRPGTLFSFDLPVEVDVLLRVFDAAGRVVVTLIDEPMAAGRHSIPWSGTRASGELVGTGVYFCRLEADGKVVTKRLVVIR
ncbi:MAG: T9SS type A sorting domain-containing protein [Candidatus Eisenbacteria sp.]|nr:T9SS type A sorting domain-containing protein [Candidatus Eisenbacteria bacterium]